MQDETQLPWEIKTTMDPSSDYHLLNDILGKTVTITLKCGKFQGVLQHVDSSRSILLNKGMNKETLSQWELEVKNLENGRHVPGVKMFFGPEIVNVELLEEPKQHATEGTEPPARKVPITNISAMDREEPLMQIIQSPNSVSQDRKQLSLENIKYTFSDRDKEEDIQYVVIDQFQKKFGSAMLHIKKQNVCSIAAEGVSLCRHGKLSWLQVATRSQVFLFDVFLLGARVFKNGLQMVLEDQSILKVIHDCRWLSDCLSHQYGIMLSNVFDTQVADVLHFSMETGGFLPHRIRTLQECLIQHLRMPYKSVYFLERRQHAVEKDPEIWFVRPLPPALLNVLALETAYLLPLRLLLLDEIMSDLTTLVDRYLNAFREGSADPLGSTEISCMDLPEELRQLADFYKVRRERAMQKFQLNEEGLLIRTLVEPVGRQATRKEGNQSDGIGFISSCKAPFPQAASASSVHLWDPVCQDNLVGKEDWEANNCNNQWAAVSGSNEESEIEKRGSVCCKLLFKETAAREKELSPKFKQQRKVGLTLEEEIKQLLLEDKDEDIQAVAVSAPSPPKMNNSHQMFQAARLPSPPLKPSCQTLSNIASGQNLCFFNNSRQPSPGFHKT
ncbi:piRNA biogenesis protein EXD1 isoform X2 [Hemicordylus capensis]|uniref:piRNA biogenesis protein EXD1 isoform X2 n=1 Tax=Hemicordylus capensis TaxID=884348 RepID=UPI0023020651|nr:piRNA biogenesis protein EXD1 isoform X2 [Hemicordylus capensis]XP_053141784.1 piRNA biogenesis protein EXD1 isoform X2 [Hemicordylus capensis]